MVHEGDKKFDPCSLKNSRPDVRRALNWFERRFNPWFMKIMSNMATLHFIATAIDNKVNTKSYKRGK